MVQWQGKVVRWILTGGAFLGVLAVAGCSNPTASSADFVSPASINGQAPAASGINSVPDPSVLGVGGVSAPIQAASDQGGPPQVNMFGEFDGVARPPAKAHGNGGFQQHTFLDEGFDSDVSLDPSGKWMVFTSTRESEHPNLYLQKTDALSVVQLTNDEADYAFPAFSPDGKHIAFSTTRNGNWDIFTMTADGKDVVQITSGPMQHVHPSFNPDGTRLVYSCLGGKSGQWELWTADLTTGEKRMIGFGLFPTWCPVKGADKIAFQRARQRGGRWFSLWTLELVDGEARQVTEVAVSSNAAIVGPSWSPDGKEIAFATIAEPNNSTSSKPLGQQDIWTINADGSNRRRVTDGVGTNLCPFWSSDNRIFFISDRGGAETVWSSNAGDGLLPRTAEKPPATGTDAVGSTDAGPQ